MLHTMMEQDHRVHAVLDVLRPPTDELVLTPLIQERPGVEAPSISERAVILRDNCSIPRLVPVP